MVSAPCGPWLPSEATGLAVLSLGRRLVLGDWPASLRLLVLS